MARQAKPCEHTESDVKDSRAALVEGLPARRRRRVCCKCGVRFTTYEITMEQFRRLAMGKETERIEHELRRKLSQWIQQMVADADMAFDD